MNKGRVTLPKKFHRGDFFQSKFYADFGRCNRAFWALNLKKKIATWFSENERAGSKAVWNFSKNSSVLKAPPALNGKTCSGLTKISIRLPTLMIWIFRAGSTEISFSSQNRRNRWPEIQRSQTQHNPRAVVGFTAFPKLSPTSSDVVGGQLNRGGALASSSSSPSPPKLPIETATQQPLNGGFYVLL